MKSRNSTFANAHPFDKLRAGSARSGILEHTKCSSCRSQDGDRDRTASCLSTFADLTEQTLESVELYKGKSFSFFSDVVKLPDGRTAKKDYVKYPGAVAVIPFVNKKDILLIRQFRYPVHKAIYEIPAGKLDDPMEPHEQAAQRELAEETGYQAKKMTYLFSYHPCAAYSTETIHIFKASGLVGAQARMDDDEFIVPEVVPLKKAVKMIRDGGIIDAKTIIALLAVHSLPFSSSRR